MAEQNLEQSIFLHAIELAAPADRAAYLDEACRDHPGLRAELDALLAAHDRLGAPLPPEAQPAATQAIMPQTEAAGTVIGPYKLIEQIGEGGMGTVWMAEQTKPIQRRVALKVIKEGMDSKQVLARFEAERQALALMEHPNIAKVLDAGKTPSGQPFFAMELVKGKPITAYCDEKRLGVRQRLELFGDVCQAVQHAHQKGIIHRDLKPSNVLVAPYDGKPVVKVIDFGVAKATGQRLTDKTLFTGFGALVGTPEYMSPEQAELNNLDIDTRSDIYSLGVLLYELLTGSTPFSRKELENAGMLEMLRVIREQEPSKPSTKLSTADGLPTLAANRGTEPAKLTKLVRGELDWIVMKALEKDRNRRYETANGFAMDVQRYLADEPVQACPPSATYRLKKFVRRNRGPVLAGVVLLVALVAGIVGTSWGLVRARRANDQAQKRLLQIETSNQILTSIFTDLDIRTVKEGIEPLEAVLARRLTKAGAELDGEAVGNPVVVAELQNRLGLALLHFGYPREALPLFLKARAVFETRLGADQRDTLNATNNLASAYRDDGQLDLALPLLEETLKVRKIKLGPEDRDTLTSMNNLAGVYWMMGKSDRAIPLWEEALRLRRATLGADHPESMGSLNNLALGYQSAGKLDLALPLFEEALGLLKGKLGNDHIDTINGMSNLAVAYMEAGKLDAALPLLEETLKLRRAKLGADHSNTLQSMNNLAQAYQAAGKLDRAVLLLEETYRAQKAKVGADHPDTLNTMTNLGAAYQDAGKLDLALPLLEETLKLKRVRMGADHRGTLTTMSSLAVAYQAAGKLDLALPLLKETLNLSKAKLGADHTDTLRSMSNMAGYYLAVGQPEVALPLLEEATTRVGQRGFHMENAAVFVANLTYTYEQLKRFGEAEVWRRKWLAVVKERSGANSAACASELSLLALNLLQQRKWTEAEAILRDCLSIREKIAPDAWTTFNVRSMLGGALLGQKKYAEAEPLLLEGYEGMKKRAGTIPPRGKDRPIEALQRLVLLYTELGKKDKADQWQRQLEVRQKQ